MLTNVSMRILVLSLLGLFAATRGAVVALAAAPQKPNVILIMADDMGYECLGCYGSAAYKTPNLDRLAAGGIRFDHCYSQPLCTPSRVKIMTGKYNFRNYEEFGYLNPRERTFGQLLREAGYRTCIAGKWQLNGIYHNVADNQDRARPQELGFDESCLWQVTKAKSLGERYADPLIEINAAPARRLEGAYGPQVFTDFVCEFIERNRDRPFFVYYPMALTHNPFVPTPDSAEWRGDRHRQNQRFFAHMVAYADRVVGQIDAKLAEMGLRNNTLLLFTGDNGSPRGIQSAMKDGTVVAGGKGTPLDAGTHVPLIASWPGTAPAGAVNDDLIDFTDFFVTLADVAGSGERDDPLDGHSFLPQLNGRTGQPRPFLFCHSSPRWGQRGERVTRFARDQIYKLYGDGRLFNVRADVLEQQPLDAGASAAAAARDRLQAVLDGMPDWAPPPARER